MNARLVKDYYKILGLSAQAKPEEIREKYRQLVAAHHPDKFLDPLQKARAEESIEEVNEAYDVLFDLARRAEYDRQRTSRARRTARAMRRQARLEVGGMGARVVSARPAPVVPIEQPFRSPASTAAILDPLHFAFYASRWDLVEVDLDRQANLILLDELNSIYYTTGRGFRYKGAYPHFSPLVLPIPRSGAWRLVIERGADPWKLGASARLIRRSW